MLLGNVPFVEGLVFGLKAAMLAIVLHAGQRTCKRALKNNVMLSSRGLRSSFQGSEH